jgi:AcrR family transcriptional regulator
VAPTGPDVGSDTHGRLLAAAVDAFAERGFHATTTRDIAARVGLSPAGLYVHFPSKAALLAEVSRIGHEGALALVGAALEHEPDPVAGLRLAVRDFAAWHAENHRVARVVQYEFSSLPPEVRAELAVVRRAIETLMADRIADGVRAGVMRVDRPRPVARAILSLSIDIARWYDPAGRESPADLGALYADLATRMVGATEPGR